MAWPREAVILNWSFSSSFSLFSVSQWMAMQQSTSWLYLCGMIARSFVRSFFGHYDRSFVKILELAESWRESDWKGKLTYKDERNAIHPRLYLWPVNCKLFALASGWWTEYETIFAIFPQCQFSFCFWHYRCHPSSIYWFISRLLYRLGRWICQQWRQWWWPW